MIGGGHTLLRLVIMRTMSIITIYQEYKDDQIFQGDLQGLA